MGKRTRKGISLIECMVILAIVSVLIVAVGSIIFPETKNTQVNAVEQAPLNISRQGDFLIVNQTSVRISSIIKV